MNLVEIFITVLLTLMLVYASFLFKRMLFAYREHPHLGEPRVLMLLALYQLCLIILLGLNIFFSLA